MALVEHCNDVKTACISFVPFLWQSFGVLEDGIPYDLMSQVLLVHCTVRLLWQIGGNWALGDAACKLMNFFDVMSLSAISNTMVCIALNRLHISGSRSTGRRLRNAVEHFNISVSLSCEQETNERRSATAMQLALSSATVEAAR